MAELGDVLAALMRDPSVLAGLLGGKQAEGAERTEPRSKRPPPHPDIVQARREKLLLGLRDYLSEPTAKRLDAALVFARAVEALGAVTEGKGE